MWLTIPTNSMSLGVGMWPLATRLATVSAALRRPGEDVWGDRFSTGQLCHDIDKATVEGPQVVIGRVRPHVDRKLAL
jgi:hypothetical protein